MIAPRTSSPVLVRLALLTLIAFGLQTFRIDAKSLWSDEGLSVYRARLPIGEILTNHIQVQDVVTVDTHPPLYFVLLGMWRGLTGESEFALRWLSVLMGTLAIPLLYVTGRRLASPQAGLWSALVGTLSPFVVWFAQDARMYTLLMVEVLLATYLLLRWLDSDRPARGVGIGYALVAAGLMLTHYTGILVFVLHLVALILAGWKRSRRATIGLMLAASAAALPTLMFALQRLSVNDFPPQRPLEELLYETWNVFALGPSAAQVRPLEQIAVQPALSALGVAALVLARKPARGIFLAAWLFFPLLAFYFFSFVKPAFVNPRNVSIGLPALLIGMGAGLAALTGWRRVLQIVTLAWLGVWCGLSILQIYYDASLAKDDIRSLARHIEANQIEGDAIVLHDAIIRLTFDYYYRGGLPEYVIPTYGAYADAPGAIRQFEAAAANAGRIWFVWGPAPVGFDSRLLPVWAREHMFRIVRQRFAGPKLPVVDLYQTRSPVVDRIPDEARRFEPSSASGLGLVAAQVPNAPSAMDRSITLSTYWQVSEPVADGYTVTADLVDASGQVRGSARQPLWRYFPPYRWPMHTTVRWDVSVRLAAGSPPGTYRSRLTVVPDANAARAGPIHVTQAQQADYVEVGEVSIARPTSPVRISDLGLTRQIDLQLDGGIKLLGYAASGGRLMPGSTFLIDLFWQVTRIPAPDSQVQLELRAPDGRSISSATALVGGPAFPAAEWRPGDVIRTTLVLNLPLDASGGQHSFWLSRMSDSDAGIPVAGPVVIGAVPVEEYPLNTAVPTVAHPLVATFGDMFVLHGYDLRFMRSARLAPGDTLTVSLIWQALRKPDRNYVVLVHLMDAQGYLVTQGDSDPLGGLRPTLSWRAGEVIRDEHLVSLPADMPAGTYSLYVGWYDRDSPLRLPVKSPASQTGQDRLELTSIEVDPAAP